MSEPLPTEPPHPRWSKLKHLDQACDRFEAAWQAGERPSLEAYLGDTAEPERSFLLRGLVELDIEYRRQRGEQPTPHEYHERFPALDMGWLMGLFTTVPASALVQTPAELPEAAAAPGEGGPAVATHVRRIRCPHCQSPIQLVDERPDEVLCPSCGSSFLLRDTRQTATTAPMRLVGKFQLLERVGLGAMGAVWRARDTVLDKIVAVKIPHATLLESADDRERIRGQPPRSIHQLPEFMM